jgi:hypothetical protein
MTLHPIEIPLNFFIYEEIFSFFFISVHCTWCLIRIDEGKSGRSLAVTSPASLISSEPHIDPCPVSTLLLAL